MQGRPTIDEGDRIPVGDKTLEVWSTPGHTAGQLALRMGNLLFSGDNIFRDGCVGVIDAHHGSNLVDFIASLKRIRESDVEFLLPSHGPIFRKDNDLIDATIARLRSYSTCPTSGLAPWTGHSWMSGKKSWPAGFHVLSERRKTIHRR